MKKTALTSEKKSGRSSLHHSGKYAGSSPAKSAGSAPAKSDAGIAASELPRLGEGWLLEGEICQHSRQTLAIRRFLLGKLSWFLTTRGSDRCGTLEMRQFLAYASRGHEEPGGRWGNPHMTRPVRPSTIRTYWLHLSTFFRWLVAEGLLGVSPMQSISAPISRADQIQPFSDQQIEALLCAARRTLHPRRDEALLLILLDTGLRATEVCSLRACDLDMQAKRLTVQGKGGKQRSVYFGKSCAKALWNYLREEPREPDAFLFLSDRGGRAGEGLTRSGLGQLLERLGKAANLEAVRVSPHTCRHTFAVSFLRAGGNVFSLQTLLGHTDVKMTQRYVRLADSDIERQHRQYSPMDRLRPARK